MTPSSTPLNLARSGFVLLTTLLGISIAFGDDPNRAWIGALAGLGFGIAILLVDVMLRDFSIRGFSTGTFGLLVGLLCAWLVTRIGFFESPGLADREILKHIFELGIYLGLGFLGMMLALRSQREEFSLIIPYVRFRQDAVQDQPLLLDGDVIVDGRIPKLCASGFLGGSLIAPRFVLDELHALAESEDEIFRQRGKRGLECLERMRSSSDLDLVIEDDETGEDLEDDARLVQAARRYGARLLTNSSDRARVVRLQGVTVLDLNELARSLRPMVAPGDAFDLELVKEGKDGHQAVGFLEDGTMMVVNHAVEKIGSSQRVVVAGSTQTSAGRLVFGELEAARDGKGANRKGKPMPDQAAAQRAG